jgi:hypothetical protein
MLLANVTHCQRKTEELDDVEKKKLLRNLTLQKDANNPNAG